MTICSEKKSTAVVLVVGIPIAKADAHSFLCQIVPTEKVTEATRELRRRQFDVVIVCADFFEEANLLWVERLRAAMPFLPVVVLLDPDRESIRRRFLQCGAVVLLGRQPQVWRKWLSEWLARTTKSAPHRTDDVGSVSSASS